MKVLFPTVPALGVFVLLTKMVLFNSHIRFDSTNVMIFAAIGVSLNAPVETINILMTRLS